MRKSLWFFVLGALASSLRSGDPDPFVGTWRLDVHKSKYADGMCPKSMTIEMTSVGNGVQYRSETIQANGKNVLTQYRASYNGSEAIVSATGGLMAPVSLDRLENRKVLATYRRSMRAIATSLRIVSKDGRTMTIKTVSRDKDGRDVTNIGVYTRLAAREPPS